MTDKLSKHIQPMEQVFQADVEFKNDVDFQADVEFKNDVDFEGSTKFQADVEFKDDVDFEGSTKFQADVEFKDDVDFEGSTKTISIEGILDVNGTLALPVHTVSLAPTATIGHLAYFSDGAEGNPVLAFGDGTNWLRVDTLAAISDS
jgi:hypothetical protein